MKQSFCARRDQRDSVTKQGSRVLITTQGEGRQATAESIDSQDKWKAQNGRISQGWQPGENWKPQTFINTTGAKVQCWIIHSLQQKASQGFNLIAHPDALQIGFVSTTAEGYKQTKQWVNYHRVIGVTHFYLFVDGQAARPEVRSFYSSFMLSSCTTDVVTQSIPLFALSGCLTGQ